MATPILTTPRLTLRPITLFDAADITSGLSNAEVTTWLTSVPYPYRQEDAESYIALLGEEAVGDRWAIDAGTGLIGVISHRPDLGYWLHADHQGQGFMTEAARAVVAYHFTRTDEDLTSGYHLGNAASANVLTKLGFVNSFVRDEIKVATGKPVPTQRMVLTKDTWTNR